MARCHRIAERDRGTAVRLGGVREAPDASSGARRVVHVFGSDEQLARVCRAFCSRARLAELWTSEGPTAQAMSLLDRDGGPLSSGESPLAQASRMSDGPRRARSGRKARSAPSWGAQRGAFLVSTVARPCARLHRGKRPYWLPCRALARNCPQGRGRALTLCGRRVRPGRRIPESGAGNSRSQRENHLEFVGRAT